MFKAAGKLLRRDEEIGERRSITEASVDILINSYTAAAAPLSRELDTTDEIYNRRRPPSRLTEEIGVNGARVMLYNIDTRKWKIFDREPGRSFSRSRNWDRITNRYNVVLFVIDSNGDYEEFGGLMGDDDY